MRKTALILHTLEEQGKRVDYHALDVARGALQGSLRELALYFPARSTITIKGLLGTYEDCAAWLSREQTSFPTSLLWLGNSIANFTPMDAGGLLKSFLAQGPKQTVQPRMIIAVDGCTAHDQILRAYDMSSGASREFVLNGLSHANHLIGEDVFLSADWGFVTAWNAATWMHESFYVAQRELTIEIEGESFDFKEGDRVTAIMSGKWPKEVVGRICEKVGVRVVESWGNKADSYRELLFTPFGNSLLTTIQASISLLGSVR